MRLDKFLCELNIGTRSEVKKIISKGLIKVNGVIVKAADTKINECCDTVEYKDKICSYQKFGYYILNKPKDVVTATTDNKCKTVMDLLPPELKKQYFPVGRLDKDTTGLLLITNDGELAHFLLSPKRHVDKKYLVDIAHSLSKEDIERLEAGIDLGEDGITKPAKVDIISDTQIYLTIHEGKFHQVKRMLKAVCNEVINLKRVSFGPIVLPDDFKPGEYRMLNEEEIKSLNVK